jgi:hypothetical protein
MADDRNGMFIYNEGSGRILKRKGWARAVPERGFSWMRERPLEENLSGP